MGTVTDGISMAISPGLNSCWCPWISYVPLSTYLSGEGIRVYAVQALNRKESTAFYRELATLTDGFHLHLDQFSSIVNFMMAICFRSRPFAFLPAFWRTGAPPWVFRALK